MRTSDYEPARLKKEGGPEGKRRDGRNPIGGRHGFPNPRTEVNSPATTSAQVDGPEEGRTIGEGDLIRETARLTPNLGHRESREKYPSMGGNGGFLPKRRPQVGLSADGMGCSSRPLPWGMSADPAIRNVEKEDLPRKDVIFKVRETPTQRNQ